MKEDALITALAIMSQQQAADHFGVHLATVKRAIKRFAIPYKKKSGGHPAYKNNPLADDLQLSENQHDLVTGSLLGDGFLLDTGIFRLKQKKSRREYVDFVHDELAPFTTPVFVEKSRKPTRINGKVSHALEHWKGGYAWSALVSTRKHHIFHELRDEWYPNGHKILPVSLSLNAKIVTHWFLQDGCHNAQKHYHKFSTQSFNNEDASRLSNMLNQFIGINSVVQQQGGPVIYVTKTNGEEVLSDLLRQHSRFKCFKYKLNST